MVDAAAEHHYHTILTVSRENQQIEKDNIESLLGMRVDGLLVCVSQRTSDPEVFKEVQRMNIPFVFFDRDIQEMDCMSVSFNDVRGAFDAVDRVIKNGYSRIAHFAGYSNVSIGKKRCEGYRNALKHNGLDTDPAWILEGGFEILDGYHSFMTMVQHKKIPEIILTVNDRVALGAYKAINRSAWTSRTISGSWGLDSTKPRKCSLLRSRSFIRILGNWGLPHWKC